LQQKSGEGKYEERVDIVSPGGACKGITHQNFGTVSIARNSILASMLHRIGYIEQMGTGIMRMKNAAKEARVSEPEFEFSSFFKVRFKRNASIQSTDSIDTQETLIDIQETPIDTQSTPIDTQSTHDDRKSAIIAYLGKRERVTASDIATLWGVTNGWARTVLRQMASEGIIEKVGNYRYAHYVLKRRG